MLVDWSSDRDQTPPSSPLADPEARYDIRSPRRPITLRLPRYDPSIPLPDSATPSPLTPFFHQPTTTAPSAPPAHLPGNYDFWLTPEPDTGLVHHLSLPKHPSYFEAEAIKLWTDAARLSPGAREDQVCEKSFKFLVDVLHTDRQRQPQGQMQKCTRCKMYRLLSEGGFLAGVGNCERCLRQRRTETVRKKERKWMMEETGRMSYGGKGLAGEKGKKEAARRKDCTSPTTTLKLSPSTKITTTSREVEAQA